MYEISRTYLRYSYTRNSNIYKPYSITGLRDTSPSKTTNEVHRSKRSQIFDVASQSKVVAMEVQNVEVGVSNLELHIVFHPRNTIQILHLHQHLSNIDPKI